MKFKYYFLFFFLMSFSNKVNALGCCGDLDRLPSRKNMSPVAIFEVCYIGISFIYAGYETIRILFVDKIFNDNKLYLITNITKLLGGALILFGFFSENENFSRKTLCRIGVACTLVSSISSIINLIIQEEFKKNLTSSILGCLKCVIDLFLSGIVYRQASHI